MNTTSSIMMPAANGPRGAGRDRERSSRSRIAPQRAANAKWAPCANSTPLWSPMDCVRNAATKRVAFAGPGNGNPMVATSSAVSSGRNVFRRARSSLTWKTWYMSRKSDDEKRNSSPSERKRSKMADTDPKCRTHFLKPYSDAFGGLASTMSRSASTSLYTTCAATRRSGSLSRASYNRSRPEPASALQSFRNSLCEPCIRTLGNASSGTKAKSEGRS